MTTCGSVRDIPWQIAIDIGLQVCPKPDAIPFLGCLLRLFDSSLGLSFARALYQCHTQISVPAIESHLSVPAKGMCIEEPGDLH